VVTTAAIDRSRLLQSVANLIANALTHGAVISPNVVGTLFAGRVAPWRDCDRIELPEGEPSSMSGTLCNKHAR